MVVESLMELIENMIEMPEEDDMQIQQKPQMHRKIWPSIERLMKIVVARHVKQKM
jgi:hypothetical protein